MRSPARLYYERGVGGCPETENSCTNDGPNQFFLHFHSLPQIVRFPWQLAPTAPAARHDSSPTVLTGRLVGRSTVLNTRCVPMAASGKRQGLIIPLRWLRRPRSGYRGGGGGPPICFGSPSPPCSAGDGGKQAKVTQSFFFWLTSLSVCPAALIHPSVSATGGADGLLKGRSVLKDRRRAGEQICRWGQRHPIPSGGCSESVRTAPAVVSGCVYSPPALPPPPPPPRLSVLQHNTASDHDRQCTLGGRLLEFLTLKGLCWPEALEGGRGGGSLEERGGGGGLEPKSLCTKDSANQCFPL